MKRMIIEPVARMSKNGKPATARFYWVISVILQNECVRRTCLRKTYLISLSPIGAVICAMLSGNMMFSHSLIMDSTSEKQMKAHKQKLHLDFKQILQILRFCEF